MDESLKRWAGGCDWAAIWRDMYDAERAQADAVTMPDFEQHADQWASRAASFAASSRRTPQPDGFMQFLLPRLHPTDTVLDIGAGSGRYLTTLARAVRHVLALEPSAAMRAQIHAVIDEERLANVTVLADAWPTPNAPQVDVAISAHVVYAVGDLGPFLQAMHDAASARYLYLGIQHPTVGLAPFWEHVRGEPRLPLPAALEAFNLLYQLGMWPNLNLVSLATPFGFATMDEALASIRQRLRFAPSPASDQAIIAAAAELLTTADDGTLHPAQQPTQAAVIWW